MTAKEDRQENFKMKCFSACLCDFCENGKETPEEIDAFKKFAKFEKEAKQLRNEELENLREGMSLFGTKDQSKYKVKICQYRKSDFSRIYVCKKKSIHLSVHYKFRNFWRLKNRFIFTHGYFEKT